MICNMWTVLFIRWANGTRVCICSFQFLPSLEVSPCITEANSGHNILELYLSKVVYLSENVHGGEFLSKNITEGILVRLHCSYK